MSLLSSVAAPEATPIDAWLARQTDLTAVEQFSRRHDAGGEHLQSRYYRDLVPALPPGPGQQYGFEVDLDACTGCKACVAGCHSLNGLDDGEAWRTVTLLTGGRASPVQQTVTAACHHCVEPACLQGCPVDAYEKDPVTGIVAHLDDQCIGCSYCTLTCPYEVPVYNHDRGIVRKCDMCTGRLAAGEAPACVQACPNGAIAIRVVEVATVVASSATGTLLPGAPPSSITSPTTVYRSERGRADAVGNPLRPVAAPAAAHPPLAMMLVLTQLSVGAFIADLLLRAFTRSGSDLPVFDALVVVAVGTLALAASLLHLGRPQFAYRAVIGLRHSWLSREVVAFGAFTGLAAPYALLLLTGWAPAAVPWSGVAVAVAGLAGIACSVLIYSTTRRSSWRTSSVASKFVCSGAISGLATLVWASSLSRVVGDAPSLPDERACMLLVATLMSVKLLAEASGLRYLVRGGDDEDRRRARLLVGALLPTTQRRFLAGAVGGIVMPVVFLVADPTGPAWLALVVATAALAAIVVGELAERRLFFTAASAPA
jgi:Fe-S-cluster-containing dehydrogenase component/DMSO reductase anchor subunit